MFNVRDPPAEMLLTPVAGVELSYSWWSLLLLRSLFFFSFQAFSKVSALSVERWRAGDLHFWSFVKCFSEPLFSWGDSSVLEDWWPHGHQVSISWTLDGSWRAALASALMAFLMAVLQVSNSRPRSSNWTRMDGLRPSQKSQIRTALLRAAVGSNFLRTVYKCSKWAA